MRKNCGFSLLELMIAVVIVGIIASIGYPSYMEFVAKSRRADAQAALMSFAGAMERHFTTAGTYCDAAASGETAVTGCGSATPDSGIPSVFFSEAPKDGSDKYYDLRIASVSATSFELSAIPKNAQSGDGCATLKLKHTGERSVSGSGDCWP